MCPFAIVDSLAEDTKSDFNSVVLPDTIPKSYML